MRVRDRRPHRRRRVARRRRLPRAHRRLNQSRRIPDKSDMPYRPHTDEDRALMLSALGIDSVARLFDDIPAAVRANGLDLLAPEPEQLLSRRAERLAARNRTDLASFLGAGVYRHFIPAAVDQVHLAWRVRHRVHAVPARGQPGHAADDLRVPVADRGADRTSGRLCVALRRCRGHRRGDPDGDPRDGPQPRAGRAGRSTATTWTRHATYLSAAQQLDRGAADARRTARRISPHSSARSTSGDPVAGVALGQPNAFGVLEPMADAASTRACRRSAVHRGRRAGLARRAGHSRGVRRGHRAGEGQPLGNRSAVRRPVPWDPGLTHGADAPDPRTSGGQDARSGWAAALRDDTARARAGHPPRQGRQQHLHQPGPLRAGRDDLPGA